ncbi:putative ribonuclease H-like domain-containing protein [Tanacetum coccineum]|uniref:Ribonuclease H-like domain-containing protein n=1 Tax=Tanacetum coccineum TaxID=301880 RepID=A0ABQ5C9M4_9ASTR
MPSPSVSTFSFPSTTEPVFSVSTSEPVFESPNHSQNFQHSQTSQTTQSQQLQQYHTTTVSNNNAKFPYLKKEEYETWAMKMEKKTGRDPKGNIMILPLVSVEEHIAVQRETKARTILLQSLPEDHMADFHHLDDARDIWLAVKARFGGNDESKKMRKSMLKQEFLEFRVSESEGLHKGYDRALPPSWSQVAITLKTKGGLDYLSFDDLYNKLRTLEIDVKGGSSYDSRGTSAPTHSAFISAASTNSKMSYPEQTYSTTFTSASSSPAASSNVIENILRRKAGINRSLTTRCCQFDKKKELDKSEEPKALLSVDSMLNWSDHEGEDVENGVAQVYGMIAGAEDDAAGSATGDATGDVADDVSNAAAEFALMGISSQSASIPGFKPYKKSLQTLEQQKGWYQSNQLALEERIRILTANLENTTNMLKYTKKLNEQAKLEKLNDKVKLEESKARFVKAVGMHVVPSPITGTFMPPSNKPDLDNTQVTYGSKSNNYSETNSVSNALSLVITVTNCDFYEKQLELHNKPMWNNVANIPSFVPKATSVHAGSRNRPTFVPAGSRNKPTSVPAGRPFSAGKEWEQLLSPQQENPHKNRDLGIVDSGCSRSMTGNKEKLDDFVKIVGGKQHKASYKAITAVSTISAPLQLLHMDLFGPTSIRSIDHKYYSLVVTDDFSRTPQQNGVAERKNRTLIEAARTMLADSKLPTMFWTEVVSTACYVLNRVLVTKPHNKTPYELVSGKVPNISTQDTNIHAGTQDDSDSECDEQFRLCRELLTYQKQAYEANATAEKHLSQADLAASRNRVPAGKIDSAAGVSDGPTETSTPVFKPVHTDATSLPPGHSLGSSEHSTRYPSPSDLANSMSSSSEMEDIHHHPDTGIFSSSSYDDDFGGTVTNLAPSVVVDSVPTKRVNTIHPQSQILGDLTSPIQTRGTLKKSKFGASAFVSYVHDQQRNNHTDYLHCLFACFLSQLEPSSVAQALNDPAWVEAMQEEMQQFINQKVWQLVPLPDGKIAIGTKWILKNKRDARGIVVRNKARLVAQGHRQEEGIDYDEVFAPVARIEAIRLFLAFASYMGFMVYQMDVKSAFLYREIEEEVYVTQPKGFEYPHFPKHVYRVVKALYGLHQAPRACQDKYVQDMLKKFDIESVRPATTPFEASKPQSKDEPDDAVNVHLYRSMIGSLMYLIASRPDIQFAASACSRHQVTPLTSNLNAVKKIFKYLKGQPKLGLWYPRDSPFVLEAYSDSDYAGSHGDRKSTTGGCQFLGRRLISWQCKKQTIVATSSTEA